MNTLFGVSMNGIMVVLLVLLAACVAAVAWIYFSDRVMFRMGLRNLLRRRTQAALIVVGLMLSTLLTSAAFTTGDSLNYSVAKAAYDTLQRTDLLVQFRGSGTLQTSSSSDIYVSQEAVGALNAAFRDDPDIEGFMPQLFEPVPVLNPRTRLSEPFIYLAGDDPSTLARFGGLTHTGGGKADLSALANDGVYVSKRLAGKIDARAGDTLTVFAQGKPWTVRVAGIVRDEVASGVISIANPNFGGGMAAALPDVQAISGHSGQVTFLSVVLRGGVRGSMRRSDAAAARLKDYLRSDAGRQALGLGDLNVAVTKIKQDNVQLAELLGNVFTTLFLVLGLFSIAAGVLLIFTIFVMLAAERRTEMGITRAVGAERRHLVEAFVAEGMAYDLCAGVVGAALGVGAAFVLVIGGVRLVMGESLSFVAGHITVRTIVVSYSLGVVLTFLTVLFSSLRISRLNIVAAVRGLDDRGRRRTQRKRTRWLWVVLSIPGMVVPPLGLYWLLRKGLGLPWSWLLGPGGIAFGALLIVVGKASGQAFPFTLGVSLLPIGGAVLAGTFGLPNRPVWTAAGALLALYWLLPFAVTNKLSGKLSGGMEMFVFSGVMIVASLTVLIVFNARMLTAIYAEATGRSAYRVPLLLACGALLVAVVGFLLGNAAGGLGQLLYLVAAIVAMAAGLSGLAARFPRLAPALKMAVAYPLANRFRTGMTIAMFSLVVFSITEMSVINASFLKLFVSNDARGGWDVLVETNRNNPVDDLPGALQQEGTFNTAQIVAIGGTTPLQGNQEVRQAGREAWKAYPVLAGDDSFYGRSQMKLEGRVPGYDGDRAVFEALRTQPNLAVIDSAPMQPGGFGPPAAWQVQGVSIKNHAFAPFQVEVHNPINGEAATLTVIGVLSAKIPTNLVFGIFTNAQTYARVFGSPDYRTLYLRLTPGTDPEVAAKGIKAALMTKGVQAYGIQKQIDDTLAASRGFMRIFQAFMGLGLFVGIAALGVIAFRAVVERRQQIGMLRAIGYQRSTVALSFLLESTFIAGMGILSGVVGACILARNLLTSDYFGATSGLTFYIPWLEVIAFVAIAYAFAMLMTWWPSRRASRVVIAEALRYE